MINDHRLVKQVCILQLLFLFALSSIAQDIVEKKKWNLLVEPYILFPNMKGTVGVGTLPDAELDADAGDIFSHFKAGALLYTEMANDKWAITLDFIYIKLEQDATPGFFINSGKVTMKQLIFEVAGLRKLTSMLDAGIGVRLNNLVVSMDMLTNNFPGGGTTARYRSLTQKWVDPIIIARFKNDPNKKFIYQIRGDIGGFGIGADLAWQIQAYAGYRFSKLFQLTGGYRILSVDYNTGTVNDRFLYDVDTFGPVLRFGFNF